MRKLYTILISLLSIAGILVLVYVIYIVIEKRNSKSKEESKPEKEGSKKNPTFKLPRGEEFDIPVEGSEFEKEHREPRENIWVGFREPYCPLLEKGITGERWNKGVPRFRTEYGYSNPRTKEEEKEMLREMSLNEERIIEEERLLNEQRKIEETKINEIKRAFEREREIFKEENTVIKQKLELESKRLEEANIKLEEEWKRLDSEKRILENEKKIEEVMLVKKRNQLEEERRIVEEEIKIRDEKLSEMKDLINEIKRLEEEEEHEAEKRRLETIRNAERHYCYKTHEEPPKSLHTSPVFVKRERLGRLLRSVGRDVSAQKEHSPMSSEVNELIRQNRLLEEQIQKEKEKIYPSYSEEPRSLYMPGRTEVPSRHSKERQMMEEGSLSTILEEESTKQEKEPALHTEDPKISEKVSGEIPAVSKPEEPVSIVYESPIEVETKTVTETTPTLPSERTTSTTEKEPTQKPLTKKATITSVDESLIPSQNIPSVKHEKAVKTTVPQFESKEALIQEVKTEESTGKRKLETSSSPSKFQRRNISGDVEGSYTFKIPVRREFESVETKTKLANPSEVAEMSELPAEQASKQEVLIPEQAGMIVNPEQEKEILESESKFLPSHLKKQIKSKVNALEEKQEIKQRKGIPASLTEKTSSLSKNYEFIPSLEEIEAETQKEEQQPPLLQVENVERTINVPREVIKVEPSEVNREMFEFIPILKEIEAEAQKEEQKQLPVSHVENVEKTIYVPNETINVPSEEPLKESFVYPSSYEKSFQQPLVSEKQKIYSRNPEEKKTKLALEKGYSSDPEEFLKERESEVQPKRLVRRQSFGETPHIMSKLRRNIKKEEKVPITESTPLIEEKSALQQTKPPVTEVIEVNQPAQIQVEDYEQWFARSREKGSKEKLPVEEKPLQQTAQQSSEISEGEEGTFITKKRRMSPVYSSSEEEGTQSTRERSRSPLYSSSQRELLFDEEQARMQKEKLNKAKLRSKKIRKELKERRSKKSESEMTEENVPVKETEV